MPNLLYGCIVASITIAASHGEAAEPTTAAPAPAVAPSAKAAEAPEHGPAPKPASLWDPISFGTLWYLHGGYSEVGGNGGSLFKVGRGYLTSKYKPARWFESRASLDVHQDDTGDIKVRIKYMYAKFKLPIETAVVTKPYLEVGVVHGPWLDYEEHINIYRMQGTMFQERNRLFNSADIGMTAVTLLGRELPKDYQKRVSTYYPGRWGSLAIGMYNGGGYHAKEQNDNKVVEGRLSLRPLGFVFPNLQTSYMLYYGRGNTSDQPRWENHALMASVEHERFVVAGTYAFGIGNQKGNKRTPAGNAMSYDGYSVFAELKLAPLYSSIIGRYDRFDWGNRNTDAGDPVSTRIIGGWAFHFLKQNTLLAEVDAVKADVPDAIYDWQARLTLQVKYP